jgi:fructose-1,6-bisphosphatase/inositol monophosphatase family enzyme
MRDLEINDKHLYVAREAAVIAGNETVKVKRTTDQQRKDNGTVVTQADKEAEKVIREKLLDAYSYPILGEEFGGDIDNEDTYWVVDPIDGTRNFASQQPLYGTAVALVEDDEPSVGVFYMPELDYLFYAVEGQGAYRNNEELQVSEQESVDSAYYNISGIGRTELHPNVSELNRWVQQLGCAVMAESWVASGWSDIGVFGAFGPWDIAVGVVLVREAGGVLKSILNDNSEDWNDLMEGRVVLGREKLVDKVLEELPEDTEDIVKDATYNY